MENRKQMIIEQAVTYGMDNLCNDFVTEVKRMLNTGAVDSTTKVNAIFSVALENVGMRFASGLTNADVRNLRKF
jgi:hypothetical protein